MEPEPAGIIDSEQGLAGLSLETRRGTLREMVSPH